MEVGSLELNDGLEEFVDEDRAWSHECKPLQAKVRPESAQKKGRDAGRTEYADYYRLIVSWFNGEP
jgi:hypothetical protein